MTRFPAIRFMRLAGLRLGSLFSLALCLMLVPSGVHAQEGVPEHVPASSIPQEKLLQPEAFAAELHSGLKDVLVLQVGSRVLFDEAHIPGAEYAGPTGRQAGVEVLRKRVKDVPREQKIVLYCGCCPWSRCPNIAPAWNLLHELGFRQVRVLYLSENFGANWVAKGFPSEPSK